VGVVKVLVAAMGVPKVGAAAMGSQVVAAVIREGVLTGAARDLATSVEETDAIAGRVAVARVVRAEKDSQRAREMQSYRQDLRSTTISMFAKNSTGKSATNSPVSLQSQERRYQATW
jgi:hypothetical protein